MVEDEEGDFFESMESLKQSSASLDLHESGSCLLLLPCGLLPEELAELEGSTAASAMHVEAAVSSLTLSTSSQDPPSPHTPLGMDPPLLLGAAGVAGAPSSHLLAQSQLAGRRGGCAGGGIGEEALGIAGVNGIEPALAARGHSDATVEPATVQAEGDCAKLT